MEFYRVFMEGHSRGATLYVAGFLATRAADRAEELMQTLPRGAAIVRVDLRAVDLIDPDSFVRVARALNAWRDRYRGRVMIEFPRRSLRSHPVPVLTRRVAEMPGIFEGTAASGARF